MRTVASSCVAMVSTNVEVTHERIEGSKTEECSDCTLAATVLRPVTVEGGELVHDGCDRLAWAEFGLTRCADEEEDLEGEIDQQSPGRGFGLTY